MYIYRSRYRESRKTENFTPSFGRLCEKIALKSVQHVQLDYFSSFNQSNHWFVALLLFPSPVSFLKLPIGKLFYDLLLAIHGKSHVSYNILRLNDARSQEGERCTRIWVAWFSELNTAFVDIFSLVLKFGREQSTDVIWILFVLLLSIISLCIEIGGSRPHRWFL